LLSGSIEQQEAGLLRQGASQGDALLLATGKLLGPSGGPLGGADPAQGLVRAAGGLGGGDAQLPPGRTPRSPAR